MNAYNYFAAFAMEAALVRNTMVPPLLLATLRGDIESVRKILCITRNPNEICKPFHTTPIYGAIYIQNLQLVKLLVSKGANVNHKDASGLTPLMVAVGRTLTRQEHVEIITYLINNGADIHETDNSQNTALSISVISCNYDATKILLENRANPNQHPKISLISEAIALNELKSAHLLLKYGANPNFLSTDSNIAPIHWATQEHLVNFVKELIKSGADVNLKSNDDFSPIQIAAITGHHELVWIFIKNGAYIEDLQLANIDMKIAETHVIHAMIFEGLKTNMINQILIAIKKGAYLDVVSKKYGTPLIYASWKGLTEMVNLLLCHGASVKSGKQSTPLHYAAKFDHYEIVIMLLRKGAVYDSISTSGFTPLKLAIESKNSKIVHLLIQIEQFFVRLNKKDTALAADLEKLAGSDIYEAIINCYNTEGGTLKTVLESKSKDAQIDIIKTIEDGDLKILENFLANRNINQKLENGMTLLMKAISLGNLPVVKFLLEKGADFETEQDGITPFGASIVKGFTEIAEALIHHGVNIEKTTILQQTPLHLAVINNKKNIAKLLIDKSVNINASDSRKKTPLHYAAIQNLKQVAILLLKTCDVNPKDENSNTPLHEAAFFGKLEVLNVLLDHGGDMELENMKSKTPFYLAAEQGHSQIIKTLLNRGAIFDKNVNDYPITIAKDKKFSDIVKDLELMHELFESIKTNQLDILQSCINNKANLNSRSSDTPYETPLCYSAFKNNTPIIDVLLKNGADVNFCSSKNESPLFIAAKYGYYDLIRLFLEHGAIYNQKLKTDGKTALSVSKNKNYKNIYTLLETVDTLFNLTKTKSKETDFFFYVAIEALKSNDDYLAVINSRNEGNKQLKEFILIDELPFKNQTAVLSTNLSAPQKSLVYFKGSELHAAAFYGDLNKTLDLLTIKNINIPTELTKFTPLFFAIIKNHLKIVEVLVKKGADINYRAYSGTTPLVLACIMNFEEIALYLIKNGAHIGAANDQLMTSIHYAAWHNNVTLLQTFVKMGCNLNIANETGHTPLHFAILKSHLNAVKYLLKQKADPRKAGQFNWTPLHSAVGSGDKTIVNILLAHGAEIYAVETGRNAAPIHIAVHFGHIDVLKLLINKNANVNESRNGESPLSMAAKLDNLQICDLLIQNGAYIDFELLNQSYTERISSLFKKTELFFDAVKFNKVQVVKTYLKEGIFVDSRSAEFETALMYAASKGYLNLAKQLLLNNANVELRDSFGMTALHYATKFKKTIIVIFLLEHGAIFNAVNKENKTPFDIAVQVNNKKAIKLFGEIRGLFDAVKRGDTIDIKGIELAVINCKDQNGRTLGHYSKL